MNYIAHWLQDHMLSCPFRAVTGFDCPGCGMQRSLIALLNGEILKSFLLYPALLPLIFIFIFLILHLLFKYRKGPEVIRFSFISTVTIIMINYIINLCV